MAHLLIIDLPGGNDADVLQAAVEAGHEFSFLSSDLGLYDAQPAVRAALAAAVERIEVHGFDDVQVERRVLALHERHPIAAVICLIDIRLVAAARIAHRLGLRYLNPASATLLCDKFDVRRRLAERGIMQPDFALALSNDDLARAVERLGFPVLVKPADGYGSQNIVVLHQPDDLAPWIDPQGGMLPSRADYGLGVQANDRLLVERYMEGQLVGCDTLTVDGRHRLLGVNEKRMFAPPSFAIRGSCFTTDYPGFAALERYAQQVLDAVGFDWGAAHVELMLTEDGPRVVEINARLVGAKMPRLIGFARGRSAYRDLIDIHLGAWPQGDARPAPAMASAVRWVTASEFGTLEDIAWPEWRDERICCVEQVRQNGDSVGPPYENADRIAYVMTCGSSGAEAEELAERFVAQTRLVVRETVAV